MDLRVTVRMMDTSAAAVPDVSYAESAMWRLRHPPAVGATIAARAPRSPPH